MGVPNKRQRKRSEIVPREREHQATHGAGDGANGVFQTPFLGRSGSAGGVRTHPRPSLGPGVCGFHLLLG